MTPIAERVRYLSRTLELTQEEVANIVGASPRTVARWSAGVAAPQKLTRQRLLELVFIGEQLSRVLRAQDANLWIFSPNRLLQGDSPADRIRKGDYRTVLDLIEALADGIAV